MSRLPSDVWYGQAIRFGAVGAVNTLGTSLLFYVLLFAVPTQVAYTISYLVGIAFVALTSPRFAFGVRASHRQRVSLMGCYLVVYCCGLGVATLAREGLDLSKAVTVVGTLLVTAPLNFVGSRLVLHRT